LIIAATTTKVAEQEQTTTIKVAMTTKVAEQEQMTMQSNQIQTNATTQLNTNLANNCTVYYKYKI